MAAPGDGQARSLRDFAERTVFAGVGLVVLTRERIEELADELSRRGTMTRDEAIGVVEELAARWRGEPARFAERASFNFSGFFRDVGLVTRREFEELDLRLAQVEHRLRLVEGNRPRAGARPPAPEEPVTAPPPTGVTPSAGTVPPAPAPAAEAAETAVERPPAGPGP